jgi:Na+-driven multidrug efflux pump
MFQGIAATLIMSGGILLFAKPLLGIFNGDAAVIAYGSVRMLYVIAPGFINTVTEILSGAMRGYGNSFIPAAIALMGICGTRITYVYTVFPMNPTFETLMQVFPLSWIVTSAVLTFAYFKFIKHIAKKA